MLFLLEPLGVVEKRANRIQFWIREVVGAPFLEKVEVRLHGALSTWSVGVPVLCKGVEPDGL